MIGEVNKNLKAKIVQNYGNQKQFAAQNGLQEGMVSDDRSGSYTQAIIKDDSAGLTTQKCNHHRAIYSEHK